MPGNPRVLEYYHDMSDYPEAHVLQGSGSLHRVPRHEDTLREIHVHCGFDTVDQHIPLSTTVAECRMCCCTSVIRMTLVQVVRMDTPSCDTTEVRQVSAAYLVSLSWYP